MVQEAGLHAARQPGRGAGRHARGAGPLHHPLHAGTAGAGAHGGGRRVAGPRAAGDEHALPRRDRAGSGPRRCSAVLDVVRRQWPACRAVRLAAPADERELAGALRSGADLVAADAAGDAHLRQLVAAARRTPRCGRRLLWAGSAGLLRALAPPAAAHGDGGRHASGASRELSAAAPLLLVAGSRRTLAQAQLRAALAAARRHLSLCLQAPAAHHREPLWNIAGGGGERGRGAPPRRWLGRRRPSPPAAICSCGRRPRRLRPGRRRCPVALADLAGDVLAASAVQPRSLMLVGGDTRLRLLAAPRHRRRGAGRRS